MKKRSLAPQPPEWLQKRDYGFVANLDATGWLWHLFERAGFDWRSKRCPPEDPNQCWKDFLAKTDNLAARPIKPIWNLLAEQVLICTQN